MFKIPFCQGGIEYAKFTLVENQFMKLYSGGENLDTKSKVLRLLKTFPKTWENQDHPRPQLQWGILTHLTRIFCHGLGQATNNCRMKKRSGLLTVGFAMHTKQPQNTHSSNTHSSNTHSSRGLLGSLRDTFLML